jgi:hypothetical protein
MVARIAKEQAEDVAIAWAYLIAAGLCEIGWPIGLKWTQEPGRWPSFGIHAGPRDVPINPSRSPGSGMAYRDQDALPFSQLLCQARRA